MEFIKKTSGQELNARTGTAGELFSGENMQLEISQFIKYVLKSSGLKGSPKGIIAMLGLPSKSPLPSSGPW